MIFRSNKQAPSLKLNVLSNLVSSFWAAILGILFVPVYLRFVGIEAYGIIGFFTSLQVIFFIFDFGLSPTINREIARLSASESVENRNKIKVLAKTFERISWAAALIFGAVLAGISVLMANFWVQPEKLSVQTITACFLLMSLGFALQFPGGLYNSGLMGLQKQIAANIISVFFGTMRSFGAWAVLAFVSPTIEAFLIWQVVIAFLQTLVVAIVFYKNISASETTQKFDRTLLKDIWRFAAGNTAINVIAIIIMQADKIVLSKMVSLEEFGYYSLTTTVSTMGLFWLVGSIQKVSYPQFSSMVALNDHNGLVNAYHKNSQLVSVLIIPTTLILAVFSKEIMFLWTRNGLVAEKTALLLSIYSVAIGIHCLLWVPYSMQLAHGWTRLTFYKDLTALFIFVPLLIFLVSRYGTIGGATSWLILNSATFLIYMVLMHRRILKGELFHWLIVDVAIPFLAILAVVLTGKLLFETYTSLGAIFIKLSLVSLVAFAAAILSASKVRQIAFRYVRKLYVKGEGNLGSMTR